ncbi:MAG: tRNA (guanine(10)-N(2))-dimethyltransferase [Candidatus Micrarchaeaceae archaeon]|jgi:tRNA (guanine26-N2/guanine27-N2)-dimethyltransferase|nr:tRNA (guanine(10)-N(2))-dimethyltransferase [Candidatus Micrarchaeota archaeon]HII09980.1 tRNA (guanine(10)-N(2))-dimethyltransferase [Candidatus Micrarchaeota archaeon]
MYKEGSAAIKYTKDSFLNPEARISRDISAAFVSALAEKGSSIVDSTAATGIRGIRYYHESNSKKVVFLEMNRKAFASLKRNVTANKVKGTVLNKSIQEFANTTKDKFDFIDLDPFGGVTPYIYDLMKMSRGGTYLMITATDTAVLCGADYRACVRLYDARPMHNELCQEVALRLLIGYITRIAAQFNFGVEVVLSFSYLHYMRVFLRLRHGPKAASDSVRELGYAYYCNGCLYRGTQKSTLPEVGRCKACGKELDTSGKIWLGNLYQKGTMELMADRMRKGVADGRFDAKSLEFLDRLSAEFDYPLLYSISRLTKKMGIGAVSPNLVIERLAKKGYRASKTHLGKNAIKTDAGVDVVKRCIKM